MKCNICGSKTHIDDSRRISKKFGFTTIRRRHVCLVDAAHRFSTYELEANRVKELIEKEKVLDSIRQGLKTA